jgi:hypothetical protein
MINSHDQSSELIAAASEVDVLSDMLRSVRLTGSMLFLVEASHLGFRGHRRQNRSTT